MADSLRAPSKAMVLLLTSPNIASFHSLPPHESQRVLGSCPTFLLEWSEQTAECTNMRDFVNSEVTTFKLLTVCQKGLK